MNAMTHLTLFAAAAAFVLSLFGMLYFVGLYIHGMWSDWAGARLITEVRMDLAREALAEREKQATRSSHAHVTQLERARHA